MTKITARQFIEHIVKVSQATGFQAGVGAMETAGSIISYLGEHPDKIEKFMAGGFLDLPLRLHAQGCLTWHGMNGKIMSPQFVRRHETIRKLEQVKP